jgi:hypothetical protein
MSEDKVQDVLEAVKIALDYLAKKGIVVFTREVRSVFRNSMIWCVEIDSVKFIGVIIIKTKTGEIAKEVTL